MTEGTRNMSASEMTALDASASPITDQILDGQEVSDGEKATPTSDAPVPVSIVSVSIDRDLLRAHALWADAEGYANLGRMAMTLTSLGTPAELGTRGWVDPLVESGLFDIILDGKNSRLRLKPGVPALDPEPFTLESALASLNDRLFLKRDWIEASEMLNRIKGLVPGFDWRAYGHEKLQFLFQELGYTVVAKRGKNAYCRIRPGDRVVVPAPPQHISRRAEPTRKTARLGNFRLDDVLPYLMVPGSSMPPMRDFLGHTVHVDSIRLQLFATRECKCVECGLEASHFGLDLPVNHSRPHLNLYAMKDGREVLMTKDHRIPRARGGKDTLSNLDPMCADCNTAKGDTLPDQEKIADA